MKKVPEKVRLKKLRIKKRSNEVQKFIPEKIQEAIIKAGGSRELAAQTTRDVVNEILHKTQTKVITFKTIASEVIKELKKKHKKTAKIFETNMKRKVYK